MQTGLIAREHGRCPREWDASATQQDGPSPGALRETLSAGEERPFTFIFSAASPPRGDGNPSRQPPQAPSASSDPLYLSLDQQGRVTVVVCDQFPVFARGLAKLLEEEAPNLRVTGIEITLSRAKRAIDELSPAVALIGLSGDGAEELHAIREICSTSTDTKVILLLPDAETMTVCHTAVGAGVAGYELKERDVSEIAEVVSLVARGHTVAPAAVGLLEEKRRDPDALDDVEREILKGVARSETNRELAARLHLSQRTICRRLDSIYSKLKLADRLQAAVYAAIHGLVSEDPCADGESRWR